MGKIVICLKYLLNQLARLKRMYNFRANVGHRDRAEIDVS